MSTPLPGTKVHTRYYAADGKQVPGVTTVIGILAKPELIRWANRMGLSGVDTTKYTDKAGVIGTIAHLLIQTHLTHQTPDLREFAPADVDRAENSFLKYLDWEKQHIIRLVDSELPLVSDKHRFGGTIDALAEMDDDGLTILDFKTGKAVYDEHLYQVAAYRELAKEHGHKVRKCRILQIGRTEDEGFSERTMTDTRKEWAVFQHCLAIYYLCRKAG